MNDSQAAEAAFARHRENCVVCRISGSEWTKCTIGSGLMEASLRAKASQEKPRVRRLRYWFQSCWSNFVSQSSMNPRQRACVKVGFLLLVLATLFPPWTYSYRSSSLGLPRLPRLPTLSGSRSDSSYGFLFHSPSGGARVDLNRLFVECVLIVLVASGFFLSQAKRSILTEQERDPLVAAGPSSMKGGSFYKLEAPRLPVDAIVHVDKGGNVTRWDYGEPNPLGKTRKEMEADGVKFCTAVADDITRHVGRYALEKSKTFRVGILWQRKFVIPIVVVFAIPMTGIAYYGSRRIVRNLPQTEVSKLVVQQGFIDGYGSMQLYIYNGSEFVLTEMKVSISVFNDKGNAVFSNRIYRVPAYDFYPQQSKTLRTDVGFTVAQDQRWEWLVVGAKGRPE